MILFQRMSYESDSKEPQETFSIPHRESESESESEPRAKEGAKASQTCQTSLDIVIGQITP